MLIGEKKNINIELDADVLVHLLTNPSSINLILEPLFNDCRNLIRALTNCTMTHIFREANRCADRRAKMEVVQLIDFLILYESSLVVDNLLPFDKVEIFCNRLVVA